MQPSYVHRLLLALRVHASRNQILYVLLDVTRHLALQFEEIVLVTLFSCVA